eukprot:gnl/Trimastix_PCT/2009.p1 GENE.gnl/Trimastix_PCT/2009~~gnl/Trimastix_PCT/2009.p1  ORF type:complete len:490 (+),score=226.27 gnl/Trimastix_PCT/2009:58-1527(+)
MSTTASRRSASRASQLSVSGRASPSTAAVGVIPKSKLQTLRATLPKRETAVLSRADYQRIKAVASPTSADEMRKRREEARATALQTSKMRKERIRAKEEERLRQKTMTESEMLQKSEDNATLSRAKAVQDESIDEVKRMNEMVEYAKCATIRERQLEEKQWVRARGVEEERLWAARMEDDRRRALEEEEVVERELVVKRAQDREVILQQIHERETQRLLQMEQQEREREQMLQRLEQLKLEEQENARQRAEHVRRTQHEIVFANRDAVQRRERLKDEEREEDLRITQYIKEKEQREQRYEEEQSRIRAEKELEIARIRAQQERAIDKQAMRDALRAKRAFEESEREWRHKEKEKAERARAMQQELQVARDMQIRDKTQVISEAARLEREEFDRIVRVQQQKMEEERLRDERLRHLASHHQSALLDQVRENREQRAREVVTKLQEGDVIRRAQAEQLARIERVRQQKLEEMRAANVPEKFTAELARKRFG